MTNGSNGDHLQQIERLIESNSRAIAANSAAIAEVRDTLSEAVGRTLRAVDELREVVEDRVNFLESSWEQLRLRSIASIPPLSSKARF